MNNLFYCNFERFVLIYAWVMELKLTKQEEAAFRAAGEPRRAPDYTDALLRLRRTLAPEQDALLLQLLDDFAGLVRYERRWYFRKEYHAAKKETL